MSSRSSALWFTSAAVLVCLFATLNWYLLRRQVALVPPVPDTAPESITAPAEVGDETVYPSANDALNDIVERPLFVRTRRPPQPRPVVVEPVASDNSTVDAAPEPDAAPPEFVLMGVRIDTGGKWALLRIGELGAAQWRTEGDELEGWKIKRILAASVELQKAGQTLALGLYRRSETRDQ